MPCRAPGTRQAETGSRWIGLEAGEYPHRRGSVRYGVLPLMSDKRTTKLQG